MDDTNPDITNALKDLKNGKSTSTDLISNGMLTKLGKYILQKLFNTILKSAHFPAIWNESILVLLHKSGNKLDPSNYRGISVSLNLGNFLIE